MPVRARSRASSSSRKASQFWLMARSSSSSASKPVAMTPPSRTRAAGSRRSLQQRPAQPAGAACASMRVSVKPRPAAPREHVAPAACFCSVCVQAGQLARAHLAQRDAALMRSTSLQPLSSSRSLAQRAACSGCDRAVPLGALARSRRGCQQPAFQQAAAHAGHAGVQQRKQRGRVFAAQGLRQFQVAPRGLRQVDQLVVALHLQALHMRQRAALACVRRKPAARRRRRGPAPILRRPRRPASRY